MPKFHTSYGKSGGKERLRNLLWEALASHKTRGTAGVEQDMRGYVYENPSLKSDLDEALRILDRIPYQSEERSEADIDRF
jgi:hypothetical protein